MGPVLGRELVEDARQVCLDGRLRNRERRADLAVALAASDEPQHLQLSRGELFGDRSLGSSLTGPIGIAEIVGQAAQQGVGPVFELMGLLSLNLGIFNLLPIPVLDGGMIFMLGLEALLGFFGLKLSMNAKERMINVGLILIVLLMGFVIFNDIKKHIIGSVDLEEPPAQTEPAPPPPGEQPPQTPVVPIK